jgi:branched-chain amino acid transport system ATP-binding protein
MESKKMLRAINMNVGYSGQQVLWDISVDVNYESIVCIIGANGAGKSTFVKAICGLAPLMSGNIMFKGKDITRMPIHSRAKERMILIPDERGLFPDMTVKENLLMGGYSVKDKEKTAQAIEWGYELFPVLKKRIHQNAGSLSGGEQQMLAMAKSLVGQPELLILDEPSSGLAPIIIDMMFESLKDIKEKGITILLVEQNVRRSLNICDYCYVLENGRVGMEGDAKSLREDESVKKLYLGM